MSCVSLSSCYDKHEAAIIDVHMSVRRTTDDLTNQVNYVKQVRGKRVLCNVIVCTDRIIACDIVRCGALDINTVCLSYGIMIC